MLIQVDMEPIRDVVAALDIRFEDFTRACLTFDGTIPRLSKKWGASYDMARHVYKVTPPGCSTVFLCWDDSDGWACAVAHPEVKTWTKVFDEDDNRNRLDQFPAALAVTLRHLGQAPQQAQWLATVLQTQD